MNTYTIIAYTVTGHRLARVDAPDIDSAIEQAQAWAQRNRVRLAITKVEVVP